MMPRPHLIYIAFFYPPSRSSGVYRAHATVRSFCRRGWDVTVVTTAEAFFESATGSADRSLLAEIPPSASIVRVPFDLPDTLRTPIRAGRLGRLVPSSIRRRAEQVWRRVGKALALLSGRSPLSWGFEDRYLAWIDPVVKAGRSVARERAVDFVLATGNPFSSFEAARLLSRLLDVPYGVDYRDPWALDSVTGDRLSRSPGTDRAEARVLDEAAVAAFVNAATIDLYDEIYSGVRAKAHVIFNGFDVESVAAAVAPTGEHLRFGMLGTATSNWPLAPFFDAWRLKRDEIDPAATVEFAGYLGYFEWRSDPIASLLPCESEGFRYLGPIAKTDVSSFYASLDVIVVLLFGGPTITAGKMYETLAQGTPILCVQPAGGGARRVFEQHAHAICVDPDAAAIAGGLLEVAALARSWTTDDQMRARAATAQYERLSELDRLVAAVTDIIDVSP